VGEKQETSMEITPKQIEDCKAERERLSHQLASYKSRETRLGRSLFGGNWEDITPTATERAERLLSLFDGIIAAAEKSAAPPA
jgi:hypothetical protein